MLGVGRDGENTYVQRGGEADRGWSRRGTQIPGDSGANTDSHILGSTRGMEQRWLPGFMAG